jgi:hypothetical protein
MFFSIFCFSDTSLSKLYNVQNDVKNNQEYIRPESLILSEADKAEKAEINRGQEQQGQGIIMEVRYHSKKFVQVGHETT